MPKRSNDFQRLIRRIYKQIVPHGATVTESAILRERDAGTAREVDVLLEMTSADVVIRMAVECRDRSRPADVEWVDQLIGKFRDLPVHRIVAVSRAGFTPAAVEKARANNIETRTLRESLDTDWPDILLRVAVARLSADLKPFEFRIDTEPAWPDAHQPTRILLAGVDVTGDQYLSDALRVMHGQIGDVVQTRLGGDF